MWGGSGARYARAGKRAVLSALRRPVQISHPGSPWSNSLSQWEAAIAQYAAPTLATPVAGPDELPRSPLHMAIYGLLWTIAFLIALIGVVLAARQLRPLFARGSDHNMSSHSSATGGQEQARAAGGGEKIVALGPRSRDSRP